MGKGCGVPVRVTEMLITYLQYCTVRCLYSAKFKKEGKKGNEYAGIRGKR